ncbi:MAG TPA: phage holin family protein [Longimicrobiales bacterium]
MSTRIDGTGTAPRWTEPPIPARTPGAAETPSIGTLFKELSDDSRRLVRQEVELAKAEMSEKLDVYKANMAKLVIGGVLLVAALFGVLITLNHGLTALLDQFMDLGIAYWLSPLIITVIIGLVGKSMLGGALDNMRSEGVVPRKTVASLKNEKTWIGEKVNNGHA